MIELTESHTALYLVNLLLELFKEFGIVEWQILCIITNNGANVVKMVRDINRILNRDTNQQILNAEMVKCALLNDFTANDEQTTNFNWYLLNR